MVIYEKLKVKEIFKFFQNKSNKSKVHAQVKMNLEKYVRKFEGNIVNQVVKYLSHAEIPKSTIACLVRVRVRLNLEYCRVYPLFQVNQVLYRNFFPNGNISRSKSLSNVTLKILQWFYSEKKIEVSLF